LTQDPDLHLLVDVKRVDAIERCNDSYAFRLRARPRFVVIRSPHQRPTGTRPGA
jgi:hypothetical protein